MRCLRALPKAHLHVHLEGAMRPRTLGELAARAGLPAPPTRGFGSFDAFAAMYLAACDVLRTPEDLRRLVRELVEDAAADGALWVEPSLYAPRLRPRLGSGEAVVEVVLDELTRAGARHGVGTGLVVMADRTLDPSLAVEQAELAVRFADYGVVGFGLAHDERRHPPEPFAEAFALAGDAGLLRVPHAGELAGPASIVGALAALRADRIAHGVRAVEEPELVAALAEHGTCLDVCLTANVRLGVVGSLEDHPLPELLQAGVRCSLNAGDPLLFGPGLRDEYETARRALGLTDQDLATLARTSIEASGAPIPMKDRGVAAVDAWLTSSAAA